MQRESHSVYDRSLWGEKTTEEIYHKAIFFFFFNFLYESIGCKLMTFAGEQDGKCSLSPTIINGRPWVMGLWFPLHYGIGLPNVLQGA